MTDDIRVMIVDDSSLVRTALSAALTKLPGITVVATAPDPYIARDKIIALNPDVLILDIQMPRMDGLTFLKKLRKYHPVPAIILSSVTRKNTACAIECLEVGAVEVFTKPQPDHPFAEIVHELAATIRGIKTVRTPRAPSAADSTAPHETPIPPNENDPADPYRVIVIGSSTGGTEALRAILSPLTVSTPGIVIAQHMPPVFTTMFAGRLNTLCEIEVREAADGDRVTPGLALLAPGDRHVRIIRDTAGYKVRVADGPRVCRHKPSVEVLFQSAAAQAKNHAMGVMLTGMGADGADGLLAMRNAGARTIAQDEASCVVFGMPKAAFDLGGVEQLLPLERISNAINAFARKHIPAKAA